VGKEEQGIAISDLAFVGGPGAKTGREWCFTIPEDYPLTLDNPCRLMGDGEFAAYIRKRREEFEAKHKAKV
jgi:hypothetical protein